jgi:hypothetical protein
MRVCVRGYIKVINTGQGNFAVLRLLELVVMNGDTMPTGIKGGVLKALKRATFGGEKAFLRRWQKVMQLSVPRLSK